MSTTFDEPEDRLLRIGDTLYGRPTTDWLGRPMVEVQYVDQARGERFMTYGVPAEVRAAWAEHDARTAHNEERGQ